MKYIIALMGPSQSGKSFVIEKIKKNACEGFQPKLVAKQTTRALRETEKEKLKRGEEIDVEHVEKITADLAYQTYGQRTGVNISTLMCVLNEGKTPLVVINDIMAMSKLKKECLNRDREICVISIFLFRRIPNEDEFSAESRKRGNVDPKETHQRYMKAETVFRIYIENIHMFDYVMLNTVSYASTEAMERDDTIVDKQIRAIRDNIILKGIRPIERTNKDSSVLYVISGNGKSGKDELIEATRVLGKLYADIVPKYTTRNQKDNDGDELICKNNIIDKNVKPHKYVSNPEFEAFEKQRAKNPKRFLSYWANGNKYEYTIDLNQLRDKMDGGRSLVIALSDIETIDKLKQEFGNRIIPIFCNSQISEEELISNGETDYLADFNKKRDEFIENYLTYRHVIIYAEDKIKEENDKGASDEGLIDQLFRLFRAYEEQWV